MRVAVVPADAPILRVRGLHVEARVQGVVRTIVGGLDFEVGAGEAVAIVGESGSGKSLTAKSILGLLPPGLRASGEVWLAGRELLAAPEPEKRRMRGTTVSLALQDPFTMLNPVRRCGEQVIAPGTRGTRATRRADAVSRLGEVGLPPEVAGRYPLQLSGGMRQRVGLAAALAGDPDLLIADEPSTALDVTTQAEVLALLRSLQRTRGMGLVLITHDLRVAFTTCDRVYVLYAGSLLEAGTSADVHESPCHPYTLELLLSEPPVDRTLDRLVGIPGTVSTFGEIAGRCAFEPRCRWATERCAAAAPELAPAGPGHWSRCLRLGEIREPLRARHASGRQAVADAERVRAGREDALLSVDGLCKAFGDDVVAVADASFTVGRGETLAIVGESGSGKTTLARCIAGLERPTSGTIAFAGTPAGARAPVQMVFQDPYSTLNPALSIGRTLREALAVGGRPGAKPGVAEIERLLARVGLPSAYRTRLPVALSGGERQRVAVARALAGEPQLVICDEPVSALDVSVQAHILNLLIDVQRDTGVSYLFITHDLAVARQIASRVLVMQRGRVVEAGTTSDVLASPAHPYTRELIASVPALTLPIAHPDQDEVTR